MFLKHFIDLGIPTQLKKKIEKSVEEQLFSGVINIYLGLKI